LLLPALLLLPARLLSAARLVIAGAAFLPGDRTYPRCEALYVAWFRVKEPANSSLSIF